MAFSIADLAKRVCVKRRVRLGHLMTISTARLATSALSVGKGAPKFVATGLNLKRASGRDACIVRRANVNYQVKAKRAPSK